MNGGLLVADSDWQSGDRWCVSSALVAGMRELVIIKDKDAPKEYTFNFDLPDGCRLITSEEYCDMMNKNIDFNPRDAFWGYTLLAVLGIVAIVIWRVTDKWAVRYRNKKSCPRNRIVFVRNIFISLIVAAWTDSCIVINHLVGVEKTQISSSNIIISLVMAVVVVGAVTALWCRITDKKERSSRGGNKNSGI